MFILSGLHKLVEITTEKDELSQAFARVLWLAFLSVYFCFTDHIAELTFTVVSYVVVSVLWYAWVRIDPDRSWRKYASLCTDQFLITWGLWHLGPLHIGIFLLYFWVIIGNGYRYGSKLAWLSSGVALLGITIMIFFSPDWREQMSHAAEIVVAFALVTGFTYKILSRLEDEIVQRQEFEVKANRAEGKAKQDSLTGLCNRDFVNDWLEKKYRANSRVTILFLDLDNFKEFNDNYGHHVGDQVLINISKRLTNCIRDDDVVCRYAGDEFVILLNDEDPDTIKEIGRRVRSALNQSVELEDGQRLTVTASIGVAVMGIHGFTPTTTLRNADAAMYMAKRQGRNRMAWFEEKVKG